MKRGITVALAVTLLASVSGGGAASGGQDLKAAGPQTQASPLAVRRTLVLPCRRANPQCWPTEFAFAPDGSIWYIERLTGQIRFYNPNTKVDRLWRTVRGVSTDGEEGLLGLALDPAWPSSKWVYVYFTTLPVNRLIRILRRQDGSFLVRGIKWIPANTYHNGGKIHFGPDKNLYAVTGETGHPALAQNKSSMAGKVLRFTRFGGIPAGNPFGNAVFSYGHRNSFGFAFDPVTHYLWQTENGPECNDEINRIVRGGNYAWGPSESCPDTNNSGPLPRMYPLKLYNPTIAPTGAAFCHSCGLGAAIEGNLLFGSWNDHDIRALKLSSDRKRVVSSTVIYTHFAGILDVEAGPGGVYFSAPEGIYRLVP